MLLQEVRNHTRPIVFSIAVILIVSGYFFYSLRPLTDPSSSSKTFTVQNGEGFREIVDRLAAEGIIRSPLATKAWGVFRGKAIKIKPGIYELASSMHVNEVIDILVSGGRREVRVVIPEGISLYDIDAILAREGVLTKGELVRAASTSGNEPRIEGRLFPDTYHFFTGSRVAEVIGIFVKNFIERAEPLLWKDKAQYEENLILASLVQNEVPTFKDQKLVAGILKKRLEIGMPLQVDATICYLKKMKAQEPQKCYPLSELDFETPSPYNTYIRKGLPPGPIGNPGISAIQAVLEAERSPYLYYLSDPATKQTIFSHTFEEHRRNRLRYLFKRR